MEHSNHEFRSVFDASPDPIVITRVADGRIVLVNREFTKLSGFSYEESVGENPIDLGIWPDPAERCNCLVQLQEHGAIRNVELTFRSKTGESGPFLISAAFTVFNGE
ncbi:MAG: PAS domain-containing protein, partial [Candidatus Binataceae bacterium]